MGKIKQQTLKLKNELVIPLINWLDKLSLSGKESRERTRFISLVMERAKEIEAEKKKIIEKFTLTNEDGSLKVIKEEGQAEKYDIPQENLEKLNKEFNDYMNEEYVIDILEGNKEKVKVVKDIILNTEQKFQGPDAMLYASWAEAFELLEE